MDTRPYGENSHIKSFGSAPFWVGAWRVQSKTEFSRYNWIQLGFLGDRYSVVQLELWLLLPFILPNLPPRLPLSLPHPPPIIPRLLLIWDLGVLVVWTSCWNSDCVYEDAALTWTSCCVWYSAMMRWDSISASTTSSWVLRCSRSCRTTPKKLALLVQQNWMMECDGWWEVIHKCI